MSNGTKDVVPNRPNSKPASPSGKEPNAPEGAHHLDLKDADVVQQGIGGVWNWIEENSKVVVAVFIVGALGALGYLVMHYLGRHQEKTAQAAYYGVQAQFEKKRESFERAKMKALMPQFAPKDEAGKETTPASGDLQKDYGTLVTDLEKIANDHRGTAGGSQAAILAAETYLDYKQPEKAVELAQIPAKQLSSDHLLNQLAKMLWGNALAAKGDCQAAVGVWQQVLDTSSAKYLHGDASLRSGLCFEQLGQNERAIEMYRKVTTDHADSAAGGTAKGLLRALELKAQPAKSATNQG